MDNTFYIEFDGEGKEFEAFDNAGVFYGNDETIKFLEAKWEGIRLSGKLVSEYDVLTSLGIEGGRHDWGWSKDEGFHKFTVQELHPEGCPCCGKPW